LFKCRELAKAGSDEVGGQEWNVISIKNALYSPAELMDQAEAAYEIGQKTEANIEIKPKTFGYELGGYARKTATSCLKPGCGKAWRNWQKTDHSCWFWTKTNLAKPLDSHKKEVMDGFSTAYTMENFAVP